MRKRTQGRWTPPLRLGRVPRLVEIQRWRIKGHERIVWRLATRPAVSLTFSRNDWKQLITQFQRQQELLRTRDDVVFAGGGIGFLKMFSVPKSPAQAQHPLYRALNVTSRTRARITPRVLLVLNTATLSLSRAQYLRLRDGCLKAARQLHAR